MKILFDHQMFSMQKIGGISKYFAELLTYLPEKGYECDLPIKYSENYYLKDLGYPVNRIPGNFSFRIKRRYYYFANNRISKKVIKKGDFDLFHPAYYDDYYLKVLKKPFVLTIHDMIHEKFKHLFPTYDNTIELKRVLAERATHIIAVSENTKKDIIELYNTDPDKISVVYHGYEPHEEGSSKPLFHNYILYVGDRGSYKNFSFFMEAILPLLHQYTDLKVICTGRSFNKKEFELFHSWRIQNQMIYLCPSDLELESLYEHALLFAYPSIYEGFGRPIIEAFRYGCPVCLSDASCFPEVAGDAASYFDPKDKDSILTSVKKIIEDTTYANNLRTLGRERLKMFSVEQMINNTCKVYDKCV